MNDARLSRGKGKGVGKGGMSGGNGYELRELALLMLFLAMSDSCILCCIR